MLATSLEVTITLTLRPFAVVIVSGFGGLGGGGGGCFLLKKPMISQGRSPQLDWRTSLGVLQVLRAAYLQLNWDGKKL